MSLEPIDPKTALELYLADRENNVTEATIYSHRSRLGHFVRWCDEQEITNLNGLTGRQLHEYRLWRRDEGDLAPATEKTQMDTLRVFIRWVESIDGAPEDLHVKVRSPNLTGGDNVRDVNEAAIEEWKADTNTFDRVRHVIDVTTELQDVSTVAERAHVSEPTARKYLSALAETGRVKAVNTDSGTQYMRAPQMLAMRRISAIHREHTKSEIRDAIQDLKEELSDFREQHDVIDVDELALELDPGDDGWQDVTRWQQIEQNLEIAQAALSLYDFDPDDSHSAAARVADSSTVVQDSSREQGALNNDTEQSAA